MKASRVLVFKCMCSQALFCLSGCEQNLWLLPLRAEYKSRPDSHWQVDLKQYRRFIKFPKSVTSHSRHPQKSCGEFLRFLSIQVDPSDFDTFICVTARGCIEIPYDWFFLSDNNATFMNLQNLSNIIASQYYSRWKCCRHHDTLI